MSKAAETERVLLRNFGRIERALKWGWTVRCRLLRVELPVGGIELTVEDVRLRDPDYGDDEFEVLTIQGWHTPDVTWAIRPVKKRKAKAA